MKNGESKFRVFPHCADEILIKLETLAWTSRQKFRESNIFLISYKQMETSWFHEILCVQFYKKRFLRIVHI